MYSHLFPGRQFSEPLLADYNMNVAWRERSRTPSLGFPDIHVFYP
jgi:hypothetical protein